MEGGCYVWDYGPPCLGMLPSKSIRGKLHRLRNKGPHIYNLNALSGSVFEDGKSAEKLNSIWPKHCTVSRNL